MDIHEKRIYIAGAYGMVGRSISAELEGRNYRNLILPKSADLDLIDQAAVVSFFEREKPDVVIIAAAKVGGILANDTYRAEFLYNNLMIEANAINAAYKAGVEKLIFLGSSCIYPRMAQQPMSEEALLTGPLEPTNEPYAIAKIAGIKLCENYYRQYGANFFSAMPTNLYGPHDNFDLETSHVIPALIRKFYHAKTTDADSVTVWGTGRPRREFLYVADLADAIVFLMENTEAGAVYSQGVSHVNIGCGEDIEIGELARIVKQTTGFEGDIRFDAEKPDGTPRKLLNTTRLSKMGWTYKTSLADGLKSAYEWFLSSKFAD
ncbi:GDP-L-fucose synthase [soil metagenome]